MVGACGLIFTFTTAAQTAGGGAAGGGTAGGAATVGASGGARIGATGAAATSPARTAPATTVAPAATTTRTPTAGTAAQGQTLSTIPGQNVSVAPPTAGTQGQPGVAAPAPSGTTISAPNTAATAGSTVGTTTTVPGTTTAVSFNSLPANVQAQIAAQIPAGAQLGNIVAENTPQGTVLRAQVMQNGILSEMALSGIPSSAITPALNPNVNTSGTLPGAFTGGFVVGTPYAFDQLPVPVQTAMAAQGASGVTNVTFTPAGNGGIFRAIVDGKPVEVRMAANGQILPNPTRALAATSNTRTNALTIEDVPMPVRDAVRAAAPFAQVTQVSKSETASGNVYDITMRANDRLTMMQIAENGTVIKENHDLAAAVSATSNTLFRTNEPPKLAWNSLPVAVRDAIEVQTQPDSVKTLALTNYLGKTAYVVDYTDKDALRNRLYINKQGLVVDTQTNIFGIAMNGKPVVLDDLPAPARNIVQQQAENSAVTRIDLAMYGLTPVYVVTYQRDGESRQMVVSRDGRRVDGSVGAPAAAVTGSEKGRSEAETKATEPQK